MRIRFYIMPIIWDINRLEIESDLFLKTFLNNLIRKSLKNSLKLQGKQGITDRSSEVTLLTIPY